MYTKSMPYFPYPQPDDYAPHMPAGQRYLASAIHLRPEYAMPVAQLPAPQYNPLVYPPSAAVLHSSVAGAMSLFADRQRDDGFVVSPAGKYRGYVDPAEIPSMMPPAPPVPRWKK